MSAPTGRFEKRNARAVTIEICAPRDPTVRERALTENVSRHGARVLAEREWRPGLQVLVISPREGVRSQAQVVYCQRVAEGRFAVGLELFAPVMFWEGP